MRTVFLIERTTILGDGRIGSQFFCQEVHLSRSVAEAKAEYFNGKVGLCAADPVPQVKDGSISYRVIEFAEA